MVIRFCWFSYSSAVCLFSDLHSGTFCQPCPEFRSSTAAAATVPTTAAAPTATAAAAPGAGVGLEPGAQQQPRAESCRQRLREVGVRLKKTDSTTGLFFFRVLLVDLIRTPGNLHFLAGSGSAPLAGSGFPIQIRPTTFTGITGIK
jgi:hypothetical protein